MNKHTLVTALAVVGLLGAALWVHNRGDPATLIEGDSITWQFVKGDGDREFPDATFHAGPGWQMGTCSSVLTPECETPLDHVRRLVDDTQVEAVVFLLGTNDSEPTRSDGWDAGDENVWRQAYATPPAETCVVTVLPWLTEAAPPEHRAEIDEARAWMQRAADTLPNVHTVDWRPYTRQPGVMHTDGVHLARSDKDQRITLRAYAARRDVIDEALSTCDAEP